MALKGQPPSESSLILDPDTETPKDARMYTICIDRSDGGPLGATVGKDRGESLVVCSLSEGHVTEWNRSVAKKVRVKVGDRIDSVNGVMGKDLMLAKLQEPMRLVMRLAEPVVTRIH